MKSINNKSGFETNVDYKKMFIETYNYEKENLLTASIIKEFYTLQKEYLETKQLFHAQLSMNRAGFMKPVLAKSVKDKNFAYNAYMCFNRERYYNERDQVAEVSGIDTTIFDYRIYDKLEQEQQKR
jgi:hypothetical protein